MHAAPLRRPAVLAGGLALAAVTATASLAAAGETEPTVPRNEQVALVNETGEQPQQTKSHVNGTAQVASHRGGYVVFSTDAALVPWDDNGTDDVYLRSRPDGATILVSGRKGHAGNDASFEPTISDNGRYVAYSTWSTDLAKGTGSKAVDVVVRDMQGEKAVLVSQTSKGKPGTRNSFFPVISGNGRHVSFQTFSRLAGKDQDKKEDVYIRDLRNGTTKQVSLLPGADRDVRGPVLNGDVSDDGRHVTFGNDQMLWMRDMKAGETIRFHHEPATAPCNEGASGSAGRPVISGNGQYVAFSSCSTDLVGDSGIADIFRLDLAKSKLERVTQGNGHSYLPSLSRSGRYLGFGSEASNLVAGDDEGQPDAFRKDLTSGEVLRASQGPDGAGGNSWNATAGAAISGDGHALVYQSYSQNLVAGDESDYEEVFFWTDGYLPPDEG